MPKATGEDDGVSGAETRKLVEKQRMLDLIRNGDPFDVLVMQRKIGSAAVTATKLSRSSSRSRAAASRWFYADRQRFTYGSLASNVVGSLQGEFAAEFRPAIARKTHEAMLRKAKAG